MIYSVAFVLGPSVNTLKVQLIFPFNPNFCNFFEFPTTKFTPKTYIQHLNFEIFEINYIKSNSPSAFQQHQEYPQIPIYFHFQFYVVFIVKMVQ
jgi:hypothetical protein